MDHQASSRHRLGTNVRMFLNQKAVEGIDNFEGNNAPPTPWLAHFSAFDNSPPDTN